MVEDVKSFLEKETLINATTDYRGIEIFFYLVLAVRGVMCFNHDRRVYSFISQEYSPIK
jgi:hypothetical protein